MDIPKLRIRRNISGLIYRKYYSVKHMFRIPHFCSDALLFTFFNKLDGKHFGNKFRKWKLLENLTWAGGLYIKKFL